MMRAIPLTANDTRPDDAMRHGAYLCLNLPAGDRRAFTETAVPDLANRLGLVNEFQPADGDPPAVAYLRRVGATPGDIDDEGLLGADAVVHVAASKPEPVAEFCAELARLLGVDTPPLVLGGVVRPMSFTGKEMFNFAYAHRVLPHPGPAMPNAFLVPVRKSDQWWAKGWMERHTYFLPRFDESGRMLNEGHALAAAAGIGCLLRRTYKNVAEPAPVGEYDFVSYFECADEDVAAFHSVCDALRDVTRNPEWAYVSEGPTWHGRRVATWADLF
jgi:hypothetical protein